ncbi:MAG: TrkH family potassium uptake protein [Peptostreptococcaceae bacterium]|nr:TrkH family potassium uptake protein [Peptostreptococcaceae bacterium]
MNFGFITYIIGWILNFQGLFLLVPCIVSMAYNEKSGFAFVISSLISLTVGMLFTRKKPTNKSFYAKEGFITVALGWIALSVSGALPFLISGEIPNVFNALFESISGYTTTGATILSDVESLSKGILFWRSFTHWIGGMGVLVFVLCILPLADGNNMHLMRAESPGPSVGKLVPKMRSTAMILYGIYAALTVVEGILLLFGGMSLFDAVTTSLATAGTGGFGIKNNSMADYSMYIQNVVAVFMFIFGVNFNIYFLMLVRKPKEILQSEELKTYLGIVLVATVVIALNISGSLSSIWVALQQAFFQVTSIITTTGFSTVDFNHWPELSKFILVGLMFMGGCAGSTSGGIKISRIIIAWKNLKNEISSFVHPKRVQVIRLEGRKVGNDVVKSVNAYFVLYALLFIGSMFLICIENGSFETNFTAIAATLNNVGPGLAGVGPMENFGGFSPLSKCVFMFGMLAGRLELIPMIILFSPWIWKNKRSNKKKSLKEAV